MDVGLSCYAQPFEGRGTPWAWDLDEIAQYTLMTHDMMRHWEERIPGWVLTVRYEDLVADQVRALSRAGGAPVIRHH